MSSKPKKNRRKVGSVIVEDYEKRRLPSKHYVYVLVVSWSDGAVTQVYRRYSKFFELQCYLLEAFPKEAGVNDHTRRIIPFLPGKILFGRSSIKDVAEKRMSLINSYCHDLVHLPVHISECEPVLNFFETWPEDIDYQKIAATREPSGKGKLASSRVAAVISEPIHLDQYVAVADYKKTACNEINIAAGQMVDVVEKTPTGWWFVSTDDGQGWLPSSYLESMTTAHDDRVIMTCQPGEGERWIVRCSYEAQNDDEVTLHKGSALEVLEKNLDGWWLVHYRGHSGRAPATNLLRADTLKTQRVLNRPSKSSVTVVPNMMSASNIGQDSSRLPVRSAPAPPEKPSAMKAALNKNNKSNPLSYDTYCDPPGSEDSSMWSSDDEDDETSQDDEAIYANVSVFSSQYSKDNVIPPRRSTIERCKSYQGTSTSWQQPVQTSEQSKLKPARPPPPSSVSKHSQNINDKSRVSPVLPLAPPSARFGGSKSPIFLKEKKTVDDKSIVSPVLPLAPPAPSARLGGSKSPVFPNEKKTVNGKSTETKETSTATTKSITTPATSNSQHGLVDELKNFKFNKTTVSPVLPLAAPSVCASGSRSPVFPKENKAVVCSKPVPPTKPKPSLPSKPIPPPKPKPKVSMPKNNIS